MVPKVPLKMVYLNRTKAGTSTRRHSSLRFLLHDVKDRILLLEVRIQTGCTSAKSTTFPCFNK